MPQFSVKDIGVWSGSNFSFTQYDNMLACYQTAGADGERTQLECAVPAGTYKFSQYRYQNSDEGVVEMYVNDVLVDTWDGYNAANETVLYEVPGLTLINGFNFFRFKVNGKNVASSGYFNRMMFGWLSPQ